MNPNLTLRKKSTGAVQEALEQVRSQCGRNYPLVMNGEELFTNATIVSNKSISSARDYCRVACADATAAERSLTIGAQALADWRATPAVDRAAFLFRAAEKMREQRLTLAAWEVFEAGKPWR